MIERRLPAGRIDLSALDAGAGAGDRVAAAVMARVRETPQVPSDALLLLAERVVRPVLIAAGCLAAACLVALIAAGNGGAEPRDTADASPLAQWVDDGHVPTNGELLLAFRGYGR